MIVKDTAKMIEQKKSLLCLNINSLQFILLFDNGKPTWKIFNKRFRTNHRY